MRGGEVDAIFPSPQTALSQLVHQSGLTYSRRRASSWSTSTSTGRPQGNPLLKQLWMPPGDRVGHQSPFADQGDLQLVLAGPEAAEQPRVPDRSRRGAALHQVEHQRRRRRSRSSRRIAPAARRHRPAATPATGRATASRRSSAGSRRVGNQRRATSEAIFEQQLGAIGIKIDPTLHARPHVAVRQRCLPSHDYDLAEYALSRFARIRRASTRSYHARHAGGG